MEHAPRLRKPSIRDPKLIIGVLLIALSVMVGSWAVNDAKGLSVAYVAVKPLIPGQPFTSEDVKAVELNLAGQSGRYLSAALEQGETAIALRAIGENEIIPLDAITSQANSDTRIVALPISEDLSQSIIVGSQVDLWHIPKSGLVDGGSEPKEVARGLYVSEVPGSEGAFSVGSGKIVHVVVPTTQVSAVLSAVKEEGSLTLLSIPGGLK